MAQVVVTIAGRAYRLNCEDGQESHLQKLAEDVDARTGELRRSFGEIGDQRLVVMTALTVTDELETARRTIAALEGQAAAVTAEQSEAEKEARAQVADLEAALDRAADRVTQLADALNAGRT